jgi:hypothetical protein
LTDTVQVEWDILASWVVSNNLYSDNVVWLIQVRAPRDSNPIMFLAACAVLPHSSGIRQMQGCGPTQWQASASAVLQVLRSLCTA